MPLLRPVSVALALGLLALAQAVAAVRLPVPLDGVGLQATQENYGFRTEGRQMTVTFQLRNDGPRPVRVTGTGADLPGLDLVDVAAAGEPLGFRSRGGGSEPLPAFELAPQVLVVLELTYRLGSCSAVPEDLRPVPVEVRDGRARGTVRVPLPPLPDDREQARDGQVLPWQALLVRELCG